MVDAAFAPVFRYFDVFDTIRDFGILESKPKTGSMAEGFARARVGPDCGRLRLRARVLRAFLLARKSWLSQLMQMAA